jgi:6-phosphofructokinase 1
MSGMKKIGVLTSGGDAPGMNAALRAVVRAAVANGAEVVGIERGYHGLVNGNVRPMPASSVGGIINLGGTVLRTARSEEFKTPEGQQKASETVAREGIEGLVVIGGDGSFRGALALNACCGVKVVGIPGTIDNDIPGTRYSIGFDTAINTALDAIDKIRDTSASHDRVFVVEVMGRHNGFIALEVGIAGGAEAVLVPECKQDIIKICQKIQAGQARGKMSSIIIVAEGAARGSDIAATIQQIAGIDTRLSILGHIQRGGSPSARDRALATRFGYHAVKLLMEGQTNVMVGIELGKIVTSPLDLVCQGRRDLDVSQLEMIDVMAI